MGRSPSSIRTGYVVEPTLEITSLILLAASVEVRHATWNDPAIFTQLAEQGVGFANIDQPTLGKAIRPTDYVTSHVGYVRLHGRNYKNWFDSENRNDRSDYLYTRKGLEGCSELVKTVSQSAEKTFVIANNHPDGKAAVSALEIEHLLTGETVKAPETLVAKYPQIKALVEPVSTLPARRPLSLF